MTPTTRSGSRRVLLAAPRGYCAGVERAIQTVEKALELYGAPVYVRHEIVHNTYVVKTLQKKGAIFVEDTSQVSAHGVAPHIHEEAARRRLATIDATGPLVTKVHKEAVRYVSEDYDILLIGHEGHEEVIGTSGEAPDHITLVDPRAAAPSRPRGGRGRPCRRRRWCRARRPRLRPGRCRIGP